MPRATSIRQTLNDVLLTAGTLTLLLLCLVAVDDRVRTQLALRFGARASTQLVDAGTQVQDLLTVVSDAARQQSLEHAPLILFVFAGTILVLFMFRT
jgi:hypothetical protein